MVESLSDYTGLELKVIFVLPLQTVADISADFKIQEKSLGPGENSRFL